jgi:hypothetical protein
MPVRVGLGQADVGGSENPGNGPNVPRVSLGSVMPARSAERKFTAHGPPP